MTQALITSNQDSYRASTDAAGLCREIVIASATSIQGRSYVTVEGWQAIAIAHGCAASARDVEKIDGGVRAIGEIRRMSDGVLIAQAEGFVGEDEPTWYGGVMRGKTLPRRADYAIRAMAQTRAISRACRSAFAHVVVMMKANLSTTPAEEVPYGGFDNGNVIEQASEKPKDENLTETGYNPPQQEERQRAPRLTGPMKTRAEARTEYKEIIREIEASGDIETLDIYLGTKKDILEQFRNELASAWEGDGSETNPGLDRIITSARDRLQIEAMG